MGRVLTQEEAILHVGQAKRNGRCIAFTSGCFDLLHPGHIRHLEHARSLADILVVGIHSDAGARSLKGAGRPLVRQEERAEILCALQAVDAVVIFDAPTPRDLIARLLPDFVLTDKDGGPDEIAGRDEMEPARGRFVSIPAVPGYSTSAILRRIRQPNGKDEAPLSAASADKK